jgi:uncharacterized membrane protein YcaP (DUF421 family)
MGYRQVSQLNMYDYIIGITIGSIASEMVVLEDMKDIARPLIGMIGYALFTIILSILSRSNFTLRHIIEGNPITLYEDNKIINKALKKAKIDVNEFLMGLRIQGYFDLTQIDKVILETNGNLSIYPKTKYRPTVLDDLPKKIEKEYPLISIIINGQLFKEQLIQINRDEDWLISQLKVHGYNDYNNLLLVLCDQNNVYIYPK